MTGIGREKFDIGAISTAFITGEGYRMLYRMQKHGPVPGRIEMTNSFSDKPVEVYNTVAEIKGTEKPDEVVILGAHLILDLGRVRPTTGQARWRCWKRRAPWKAQLETDADHPFYFVQRGRRRIVRLGEIRGSAQSRVGENSGVLVHDTGTGKVLTPGVARQLPGPGVVDQVLAPLTELRLLEPTMMHMSGRTIVFPMRSECRVSGRSRMARNIARHITANPIPFEKVWKDDLNQGAQVAGGVGLNTAQLRGCCRAVRCLTPLNGCGQGETP